MVRDNNLYCVESFLHRCFFVFRLQGHETEGEPHPRIFRFSHHQPYMYDDGNDGGVAVEGGTPGLTVNFVGPRIGIKGQGWYP